MPFFNKPDVNNFRNKKGCHYLSRCASDPLDGEVLTSWSSWEQNFSSPLPPWYSQAQPWDFENVNHFHSNLSTMKPLAFHSRELKHETVQENVYLKISVVPACKGRSNIAYKLNSCCSAAEMPCQNCQVADKSGGGECGYANVFIVAQYAIQHTLPPLPFCVSTPDVNCFKFKISFHRTCPHTWWIKNCMWCLCFYPRFSFCQKCWVLLD